MSMSYELMMRKKGMPSRYQEVEYIESTRTQYIDTGLIPKVTFKYKIKYSLNSIENQTLFGSRTSGTYNTSRNQIYFNVNSNSLEGAKTYLLNIYGVNNVDLDIVPTQNVIVETPIIQNENCVLENATRPIYLFALNNQGSAGVLAKTKMYYLQIYDNGTLVRNFIPVYDTLTNKYGMWESVQGKFYGNDGTGDFKGSIVGYTKVGRPTITDGVVSGFSSANYLQTSKTCDFSQVTNYEVVVKCKLTSSSDSGLICLGTGGANSWRIWINSGNSLNFSTSYHSERMTISGNFVNNDYYIRVKYNNGTVFLGYSLDNVNYTETSKTFTNLSTANAKINIGYVSNYGIVWNGSINLNETYIKINNKLWFNGQQA